LETPKLDTFLWIGRTVIPEYDGKHKALIMGVCW
jgi:hypothetical protein